MIDFFINVFTGVYNFLPDSFIQSADFISKENLQLIENFLNYLNWIVPFDIASNIMAVWLPCILLYYIVANLRNFVIKFAQWFFTKGADLIELLG